MQCKRKVPFHTRELAEGALRRYVKDNPRNQRNKTLVVYQCSQCGLFHLGHVRAVVSQPAKQPNGPTPGEVRRAEKRAAKRKAEQAQRNAFYADYQDTLRFCQILINRRVAELEAAGVPKRNSSAAF